MTTHFQRRSAPAACAGPPTEGVSSRFSTAASRFCRSWSCSRSCRGLWRSSRRRSTSSMPSGGSRAWSCRPPRELFDIIDPSGISETDLKWQPPLGSWIAAAAVHLPGPLGSHGLELVDYLSAASLVPASFFLRTGFSAGGSDSSRRVLVALAHDVSRAASKCHAARPGHADGDGHILGISRTFAARGRTGVARFVGGRNFAGPVFAGGRTAGLRGGGGPLGARAGQLRAAPEIAAGDRPRGGAHLVRLAGVPLARRAGGDGVCRRRMVGADDALLLRRRFLAGWLWGMRRPLPAGAPTTAVTSFREAFALRFVQEFFAMARVLAGLTLLGLWTIGRGLFSPGLQAAGELFVPGSWFVWALLFFAAGLRDAAPVPCT